MAQKLLFLAFVILMLAVLTLASCSGQPQVRATLSTPEATSDPALIAIMLTQEQDGVDAQAAATAEMARAMAQAILNSANATLGVAKTQDQNDANQLAAQLAATAEIVRANAEATLVSAAATQAAAQTQDSIRQTQVSVFATSSAQALLDQQSRDALVAGTQTAIANIIATQTRSAVATSQWYDDQKRLREEQMQGPITYLWMCCLPIFLALLAGLGLWGLWRWLRIQQANQRLLEAQVDVLPPPQSWAPLPVDPVYLDNSIADHHPQLTKPDAQVEQWLNEVKSELESSEEKDKDDNTDS